MIILVIGGLIMMMLAGLITHMSGSVKPVDQLFTPDFSQTIDLSEVKFKSYLSIPLESNRAETDTGFTLGIVEIDGVEHYMFTSGKRGIILADPDRMTDKLKYIDFDSQKYVFSISRFGFKNAVITYNRYLDEDEKGKSYETKFSSTVENGYSLTPLFGSNDNNVAKWATNIDLITLGVYEKINQYEPCPAGSEKYCFSTQPSATQQLKFRNFDDLRQKLKLGDF